jgi:hypothetical protein
MGQISECICPSARWVSCTAGEYPVRKSDAQHRKAKMLRVGSDGYQL